MKAILLLAFLAFAAQATTPIHEIYQGFIYNLPFDYSLKYSLLNQGNECLNSVEGLLMKSIPQIFNDMKGKNLFGLVKDFVLFEDAFEHQIAPQCVMVYQQIVQAFMQNMKQPNISYDHYTIVLFSAAIQQEYGQALEMLITNRFYSAGEKIAKAFSIAGGMIDAELPKLANHTQYAPFEEERFIREFIAGAMQELGAQAIQTYQVTKCVQGLVNSTKQAFSNPALHRGDKLSAVHAFLEGAMLVTDSLHQCSEIDLSGVMNVVGLLQRYPLQFILKLFVNESAQKLTIMASQMNFGIHGQNGEYYLAGKDFALQLKAKLKDIVF